MGMSGDNGPGLAAAVNVAALAVAPSGAVVFADSDDHVIRQLTPVAANSAVLATSPTNLYSRGGGLTTTTAAVSVFLSGGGAFTWNATVNGGGSWLSISPTSGTGSGV